NSQQPSAIHHKGHGGHRGISESGSQELRKILCDLCVLCGEIPAQVVTASLCRGAACTATQRRGYSYAFARRRDATRFSAPPVTINSCAAGLSGGKGNDFPSMVRIDLA